MTPRRKYSRLMAIAEQYGEQHALDLGIECPVKKCSAGIALECRDPKLKPGVVHFARRLKRMLAERRS